MIIERIGRVQPLDCGSLLPLEKGSLTAGDVSMCSKAEPPPRWRRLDALKSILWPSCQQGWLRRAAAGCRSPGAALKTVASALAEPFAVRIAAKAAATLLMLTTSAFSQTPSFPGAEGYGSTAAGGRGGDVYIVSNLNASGAGSFSEAISTAPVAGRTIVFAVSGHIRLPSGSGGTTMSKSKITIAGQTAPGDGICLWNNTLTFSGDDVVVRHLRFRYGKQAAGGDAVDVASSQRIIFDHCDMMFSTDENFSTFGTPPEFMTYQWSVNAWGLQTHSAGGLWDLDHATAHHTLWANNHTRNPKCIAPEVLDWTNNVVFGWNNPFNMAESSAGGVGISHRVNIRGSWFIHGGSTGDAVQGGGLNTDGSNKFKLHMADAALDGTSNGVLNATKTNYAMVSATQYDATASAWPQSVNGDGAGAIIGTPVTVQSRSTALKQVLSQAGALRMAYDAARPLRDELTQLCVTRVMAHQRGIITDPLELGISTGTAFAQLSSTPAPLDTDRDGMPDFYETALGMNVSTASHNTVFPSSGGIITASTFFPANTPAGYTHLEEYLHFKAQPHAVVDRNTVAFPTYLDVDLRRYTSGFTASPVFTLANVTGGTVSQSDAGGAVVRFTPTVDTFGRAGFEFTVTDAEGSVWTQQMLILVTGTFTPRDLVWIGDGSTNAWNTTSALWSEGGSSTSFTDSDNVTFDERGSAVPSLSLNATVQPTTMVVDTTAKDYTFTGSGSIGGSGSLIKRGAGTLTLRTNNSYTGTTTIEEGSVVLGLLGTTANSVGTLGTGQVTLLGNASLINAWIGTQNVIAAPLVVPDGATASLYTSRSFKHTGTLTGAGSLDIHHQGTAGSVDLSGNWSAFSGTLNFIYEGTNPGIRCIFNGGGFGGLGAATVNLGDGVALRPTTNSSGNTFSIGSLSGSGSNAVLAGGTSGAPNYTVGALNTSTTFAGQLQGNARLTKVGTGNLTLTGSSSHTGATAVNAGTLTVNGSLSASAVTVASGAVLAGGGTLGSTVAVNSGGIVAPENTLTTGALTLTEPVLRFDLSSSPGGANDRISATGAVTLTGLQTIEITLKAGVLEPGTYPLISTTGTLNAGAATFSMNLVSTPRQTFILQTTGTALELVVTGSQLTLGWSGSSTLWDIGTTSSWLNGPTAEVFYDADAVIFNDSASSGTVTLTANVAPRSVSFANSTARAFTLNGNSITGSTALAKSNTGTVTLQAANAYTGGTAVSGGLLVLGNATANASALGSGAVTLTGGTLRMFSAGNNTHAGTLANDLVVNGTASFEVAPRCGFSGDVSGSGTLNYRTTYVRADVTGNWSAFTGQLNVINGGTGDFRIATSYAWPGLPQASVHLAAGSWFYLSGTVNSGAGTTISIGALSGASGSILRGGPTGDRTLTYRIGGKNIDAAYAGSIGEQGSTTMTKIVKTGTGRWTLSGTCSHRGETVVESGTLQLAATATLTQTSQLTVNSSATLELQGATVTASGITLAESATLHYTGGQLIGEPSLGASLSVDIAPVANGQSVVLIQNTAATPATGIFTSKPENTLITSNGQTYRMTYLGGDGNDVALVALTSLEKWRLQHFGSIAGAANQADTADLDGDGYSNLLEYATAMNPSANDIVPMSSGVAGGVLEFIYTKSKAATDVSYVVEWSDDLSTWNTSGVTSSVLNDGATTQQIKALVPAGVNRRFVHLKVTKP